MKMSRFREFWYKGDGEVVKRKCLSPINGRLVPHEINLDQYEIVAAISKEGDYVYPAKYDNKCMFASEGATHIYVVYVEKDDYATLREMRMEYKRAQFLSIFEECERRSDMRTNIYCRVGVYTPQLIKHNIKIHDGDKVFTFGLYDDEVYEVGWDKTCLFSNKVGADVYFIRGDIDKVIKLPSGELAYDL